MEETSFPIPVNSTFTSNNFQSYLNNFVNNGAFLEDFILSLEIIPTSVKRDYELLKELDRDILVARSILAELEYSVIKDIKKFNLSEFKNNSFFQNYLLNLYKILNENEDDIEIKLYKEDNNKKEKKSDQEIEEEMILKKRKLNENINKVNNEINIDDVYNNIINTTNSNNNNNNDKLKKFLINLNNYKNNILNFTNEIKKKKYDKIFIIKNLLLTILSIDSKLDIDINVFENELNFIQYLNNSNSTLLSSISNQSSLLSSSSSSILSSSFLSSSSSSASSSSTSSLASSISFNNSATFNFLSHVLKSTLAIHHQHCKLSNENIDKRIPINTEVACHLSDNSLILGLIKDYSTSGSNTVYEVYDADDNSIIHTLKESQIYYLSLSDSLLKLSLNEKVYALFPDSTSFYEALVVSLPQRKLFNSSHLKDLHNNSTLFASLNSEDENKKEKINENEENKEKNDEESEEPEENEDVMNSYIYDYVVSVKFNDDEIDSNGDVKIREVPARYIIRNCQL